MHFSHEQVGIRIVGIQVGGLAETLCCLVEGTERVPSRTQADQHPEGTREQLIAFRENFNGRFSRMMREEFSSPIEEIRFARVEFDRTLILSNGFKGIP